MRRQLMAAAAVVITGVFLSVAAWLASGHTGRRTRVLALAPPEQKNRALEAIERDLIQHAIDVYAGHMSEVARRLGIGRSTLYRKVREQGIEVDMKEAG